MTVEELLSKLKKYKDDEGIVSFQFGGASPTEYDSYRGDYAELCLGYSGNHGDSIDIREFYKMTEDVIGQPFYGWKGGEYVMSKNNEIHIANTGCTSDTMLKDIEVKKGELTFITLITEEIESDY